MKTIALLSFALLAACDPSTVVRGPEGAQGTRGPQGPRGAPGEAAPSVDRIVRQADAAGPPGAVIVAEVQCAADERPLPGGCRWGKYPLTVHASEPIADAEGLLVGWRCEGINDSEHDEMITVSIVCEKAID